jgi:hypothetical protein
LGGELKAETGLTREVTVEEPSVIEFHYLDGLARVEAADAVVFTAFEELTAAAEGVIVFEGAVRLLKVEIVTDHDDGSDDCRYDERPDKEFMFLHIL